MKVDVWFEIFDPISVYLFTLVLEIVLNIIKGNKDIHVLDYFNYTLLYTIYANDTTFFLKNNQSVKDLMEVFDVFSIYFGLT